MSREQILIRGGLEERRTNITPAPKEIVVTTDEHKLYVGDGATAGGVPIRAGYKTGVTAGAYTLPALTITEEGLVSSAANGSLPDATSSTKGVILLTGDLSGSADNPVLAAINGLSAGQYSLPTLTVDAKGRITSISSGTVTFSDASTSSKGAIMLAGDLTGTAASPALANTTVTAGTYKSANVTVDAKGRITAASQGAVGFTLTVVPSFGLASAAFVAPFPMSLTQIDIISKSAAGADLAPSSSTTMAAYKNGSSALTQAFTAASTTNTGVSLTLAAGDVVYLLQSAANGTAQVSMTFRGVRA